MFAKSKIIMFQFHKVRLKEFRRQHFRLELVFQFHKVRLKVSSTKIFAFNFWSFNSIRYD